MEFKYQLFTDNSPQMAAPSNTLHRMLAVDFSVCLPGLILYSRAGDSEGSMYSGQQGEGNGIVLFSQRVTCRLS